MSPKFNKAEIFSKLREQIETNLKEATQTQKTAQHGATHEENKSEGDKDMRATEASYLARGLAQRVSMLQESSAILASLEPRAFQESDPIAAMALVCLLDEDEKESFYFVLPTAGGEKLSHQGAIIKTITPTSPLGEELIGRKVDDDFEIDLPGGRAFLQVSWVQ